MVTLEQFQYPTGWPMPSEPWLAQAGVTEGAAFRAINKAGRMAANGFTPKVIWVWSSKLLPRADYRMWRRTTFAAHAPVCVTKPGAHQCPDNRTVFGLQTTLEEFRQRQHRSRAPCTASTSPTCRLYVKVNSAIVGRLWGLISLWVEPGCAPATCACVRDLKQPIKSGIYWPLFIVRVL